MYIYFIGGKGFQLLYIEVSPLFGLLILLRLVEWKKYNVGLEVVFDSLVVI